MGPDSDAWITDGGLNAIVRVDAGTDDVEVFPLPADRPDANGNTAAFGRDGRLWFTGQDGVYGRLDPASGELAAGEAGEVRQLLDRAGEVWAPESATDRLVVIRY